MLSIFDIYDIYFHQDLYYKPGSKLSGMIVLKVISIEL
jgi:hypothetical protein